MGATDNYDLPYPDDVEFVKDGAATIQGLAEAVDALLLARDLPAAIVLSATDDALDSDGRPVWDTASPLRINGAWTFGPSDRLIIPPTSGLYLVTLSFTCAPSGGVSGGSPITYRSRIQTMTLFGDVDTDANTWVSARTAPISQDDTERITLTGLVYVDETANRGIHVSIVSPELAPPGVDDDTAGRLSIIRLGTLA